MSFTESDVNGWLAEDIKEISSLYSKKYVDYTEKTSDTCKCCYEVIANYLCQNAKQLYNQDNFTEIKRINYSYKMEDHKELTGEEKASMGNKQKEEDWFAHSLFHRIFNHIGQIIDFQTPMQSSDEDKGVGRIDLLSYEKDKLFMIELKIEKNANDSMLHAILQICTYYYQTYKKKLATDFGYSPDTKIQKVVLVFKGSRQYEEYEKSEPIRLLAQKLGVKVLYFDNDQVIEAP